MAPSSMAVVAGGAAGSLVLSKFMPQYLIHGSPTITTIYIVGLYILGLIVYHAWLYPNFLTPFKELPQMNLTGRFMNRRDIEASFVKFTSSVSKKEHKLLRCYMPHAREMLLVLGSEGIADILVRQPYHFEKPEHIKFDLNYLFAKGLFTAEGAEHKELRKKNAPAFAYRHVKSLYPVFWEKSLDMVKEMRKQISGTENSSGHVVQMHDWTTRATLDIIGLAGMGFDFASLKNPGNSIHQDYKRITTSSRQPHPILGLARAFGLETIFRLGLSMPSKEKTIRSVALENVRGVAARMIQDERNKEAQGKESHNIVSVAVRSNSFNEEDLVDEVMTFIGAGHESTSAALLWGIYSMCCHASMLKRLREEIRACLEEEGESEVLTLTDNNTTPQPTTPDQVHQLPYLNAFVNEVLRFHPSVPVTLRRTVCDTTVDGVFVPADTALALPIRAINRDTRLWGPTAGEFDPERWLAPGMANSGGGASNYANMTFLHGPRSCIGRDFARSELLFLLAALACSFDMELEDPSKTELDCALQITIVPKDGLRVRLTPVPV